MRTRATPWATTIVMACVCAMGANAKDNCADQLIEPGPGEYLYYDCIDTDGVLAQTFTCQLGGMISTVEVHVSAVGTPVGPLMVALYSTEAGQQGNEPAAVLAERAIDITRLRLPQYLAVDFSSAAIYVAPGDMLALVLRTPEPGNGPANCVIWKGDDDVAYPSGEGLVGGFSYWFVITNEAGNVIDFGLRTYLDCATPVELRSWTFVKASYR